MALNVSKLPRQTSSAPAAEPLDPGSYPGRVVQIIELGLQPQRPYKGKDKPPAYEVRVVYELADEFMKDEDGNDDESKPRWVNEDFPMYSLESTMAKSTERYMALDPKLEYGGDFAQLIGTPCNITVVQRAGKGDNAGKIYNNVGGITAMRPKAAAVAPELVNKPVVFDLDDPDLEVFEAFPDFLKNKIKSNLEFNGSKLSDLLNGAEPKAKKPKPTDDDDQDENDQAQDGEDEGDDDDW